jgi:hypothetical protein
MMNGQFVGSRMRAIIVDRFLDDLLGSFLHRHPAIELCCEIVPWNLDVRSEDFYRSLKEISYVDYVVATFNDDERNKQFAIDISLYYERINSGAVPFIAALEKNTIFHEGENGNIFCFGAHDELYTDGAIIRQEADRLAKAINDTYMELYGGSPWNELDWFLQESNRASADFMPAMLKLAGVDEMALPEGPLVKDNDALMETLSHTEHLRWNAFHVCMGYRPISTAQMRERFDAFGGENNAKARLEFSRRDALARLQVCLVHWDELDAVSETYRELEALAGEKPRRDFKKNDSDNIVNIPAFFRKAKY